MRCRKRFNFLAILLLSGLQLAITQPISDLPKILPVKSQIGDLMDQPSICVENIFEDSMGRLFLPACGYIKVRSGIKMFQFDGYDYHILEKGLEPLQNAKDITFIDINRKGELLGFASFNGIQKPFLYHTVSNQFSLLSIDTINAKNSNILDAQFTKDGAVNILSQHNNQFRTYTISGDKVKLNEAFSIDATQLESPFLSQARLGLNYFVFFHSDSEIWLATNSYYLIRWRKIDNSVKIFNETNFPESIKDATIYYTKKIRQNLVLAKHKGITYIIIYRNKKLGLFQLNENDDLIEEPGIPKEWTADFISLDKNGNILFAFIDEKGNYHALLKDQNGDRYDYSPMLPPNRIIKGLKGKRL